MALITTTEAKQQIPGLTGSGDDALLTELISVAGGVIGTYLGYPPSSVGATPTAESTSYTRYYDGPGGRELVVDVYPLTAVASIYDDPNRDYTSSYLVASSDYTIIDSEIGLIDLSSSSTHGAWSTRRRAIKVTFTAGYTTVPDWLQHAARLTVRWLWDLRQLQGKQGVSVPGGGSITVSPGYNGTFRNAGILPQEAIDILMPHRLSRALVPV